MTKEQLKHYLAGGKFKGIYNPKSLDVGKNVKMIGREITVHQNCIITPIVSPEKWAGQHCFNSYDIYGWFPEEDIDNLEILPDEFIDYPEKLPQYMYKFTYTDKSQLEKNFGKNDFTLPLIVDRTYSYESDEYVKELSNPPASKIEKAIYDGTAEELVWKEI